MDVDDHVFGFPATSSSPVIKKLEKVGRITRQNGDSPEGGTPLLPPAQFQSSLMLRSQRKYALTDYEIGQQSSSLISF